MARRLAPVAVRVPAGVVLTGPLLRRLAGDVRIGWDVRRADGQAVRARRVAAPGLVPVVCLHGIGVTSRYFVPTLRELAGDADLWAPDLPGSGRLEVPGLADQLVAWMGAAGIDRAVLVANSFGCQVAVDAAVRHPAAVAALVLNGPTTDPEARHPLGQLQRWVRTGRHESVLQLPLLVADYLGAGPWRARRMLATVLRDAIEAKLPSVEQPAVVVRGEHDVIVPADWAAEAARLLPRGRLVTVPGAGHAVNFSHPSELAVVVRDVLDQR